MPSKSGIPNHLHRQVQDAREAVQSANAIQTHVLGMMKLTE